MSHAKLQGLLAEVKEHAKACYAWGLRYWVAVELASGQWIGLHAESEEHARRLAKVWVEQCKARGASCWRLAESGPAKHPFSSVYQQPAWEGSEA
jgi:hypothetical protein